VPMNGQWIGTYSGTNAGTVVADLDDIGTSYAGIVFAYDNESAPRTFAYVELPKDQGRISLRAAVAAMERDRAAVQGRQSFRCENAGPTRTAH
jgi:hypothetical protein